MKTRYRIPTGNCGGYTDPAPMHKDDLEAHRAWVAAKQIHEQARKAPVPEPATGRFGAASGEHLTELQRNRTCRPASLL